MLVEIAGADLSFQAISRTGKIVDSGVIRRTRPADEQSTRQPRGAKQRRGLRHRMRLDGSTPVAVRGRAPAAAAAGRADRHGVGQHGARELLPLHLHDRVRRERHRDGVLLRADDQGGRRSDSAGRRAPSVASRHAAGGCRGRRGRRARSDLWSRCRGTRRTDAGPRLARGHGDGSGHRLFRVAADLPVASGDSVLAAARYRLRRARVPGAGVVQPDAETSTS